MTDEKIPKFNVGDIVIVHPNYGSVYAVKIIKTEQKRAYISKYRWFDSLTGLESSYSLTPSYISPATPEQIAEIETGEKIERCENIDWASLTNYQLDKIIEIAYNGAYSTGEDHE